MKVAIVLTFALLAGCAAKAPSIARATLAPIQVRCSHAGNSGIRMWACMTKRERGEFMSLLILPAPQMGWPVHFTILRKHYPDWVEVIERKTGLRGTIRFESVDVQLAGYDIGVRTIPLVKSGRTIAYLTWCVDGEWDVYRGPLASPSVAMTNCRGYWKKTPGSGEGRNSVSY